MTEKKFIKYGIGLFSLLVWPFLAKADIYEIIHKDGKRFFSDMQTQQSIFFSLKPANTYHSSHSAAQLDTKNINKQIKSAYTKFTLIQPSDKENFQNKKTIQAEVHINPVLRTGDKIEWWLDEKPVPTITGQQVMLETIDRGEHHLQAKLRDDQGRILMQTKIITFYVHSKIVEQTV